MQKASQKFITLFKRILPSPFTIAVLLTLLTLIIAQFFTKPADVGHGHYFIQLISSWQDGLWDSTGGGLYFAFQMMLILVLGHILALTPFIDGLIQRLLRYCTSTSSSVVIVSIGAISMGLINWGLGLIFGAIIARKVGEKFAKNNQPINYGLVGAAAYATMMVWHGGLSGSATTKAMEEGYIPALMKNMGLNEHVPSSVAFGETIGSSMNIIVTICCLVLIPLFLYFISKRSSHSYVPSLLPATASEEKLSTAEVKGAEKLDYSKLFGVALGLAILGVAVLEIIHYQGSSTMGFIQLNFINLSFLGLSLALHGSIKNFTNALQKSIGDISGILIQFPFYFGILAIMKSSGLIELFSDSIISIATDYTLPLFTFFSAGIVNFFVPSGGGQWAIQGPIIIESAQQLGARLPKTIMAMAYGDQLTNMLQPFWALPLLGITKLKPHQILPYTFLLFLLGLMIFGGCLLLL